MRTEARIHEGSDDDGDDEVDMELDDDGVAVGSQGGGDPGASCTVTLWPKHQTKSICGRWCYST